MEHIKFVQTTFPSPPNKFFLACVLHSFCILLPQLVCYLCSLSNASFNSAVHLVDRWTDDWLNIWMNEWMNEWMNKCGLSPYGPYTRRPLTGPLCPLTRSKSWEPCPLKEVTDRPQTQTSNVLRVQEKGSQINMPECRQGFTLTQHMGWGFLPSPTFPAQGTVRQPHYVKMSSQGVMPSKEASNYPGFCPVKGQQYEGASPTVEPTSECQPDSAVVSSAVVDH
jgi:hypothetical protein